MAEAVVFDFDGVLVDSQNAHKTAWRIAFNEIGIELSERQQARSLGLSSSAFAQILAEQFEVDAPGWERLVVRKRRVFEDLEPSLVWPVPGIEQFLCALRGRVRLGLCTTALRDRVDRALARFGWLDVFELALCAEDIKRLKPDPEIYLRAQATLRTSNVLIFEDSPVGITAALTANMNVVGVSTTANAHDLQAAGAMDIISNFRQPEAWSAVGLDPRQCAGRRH